MYHKCSYVCLSVPSCTISERGVYFSLQSCLFPVVNIFILDSLTTKAGRVILLNRVFKQGLDQIFRFNYDRSMLIWLGRSMWVGRWLADRGSSQGILVRGFLFVQQHFLTLLTVAISLVAHHIKDIIWRRNGGFGRGSPSSAAQPGSPSSAGSTARSAVGSDCKFDENMKRKEKCIR